MAGLLSLPNEILTEISKNTPNMETTINLRLSCKHMNAIYNMPSTKKAIIARHRDQIIKPYKKYLEYFSTHCDSAPVESQDADWDSKDLAEGLSPFAVHVARGLPYMQTGHMIPQTMIAPCAHVLDLRIGLHRSWKRQFDRSISQIQHRSSARQHLICLSMGVHVIIDVMKAEVYIAAKRVIVKSCDEMWARIEQLIRDHNLLQAKPDGSTIAKLPWKHTYMGDCEVINDYLKDMLRY